MLRSINRMNDSSRARRVEGKIKFHGVDLYGKGVDAVSVRRRIGMVFQKPNPFPKSIYENIAFGPGGERHEEERHGRHRGALAAARRVVGRGQGPAQDLRVRAVRRPAASAVHRARHRHGPEVILMDEPASALDPIATGKIEDLCRRSKNR